MAPDRWVVVDDDDTSVAYKGPWVRNIKPTTNAGNFGPVYLNTLHGISKNGTASFAFNGTDIQVWGTNIGTTDPNPNFECFVDNVSIGGKQPNKFTESNWLLCSTGNLTDGLHKLRIDVKVRSPKRAFWLDQIRYVPSPTLPMDNKVILFDNTDPAIQFDTQWGPLGGGANMTTHTNSIALVDFVGTSVSWVAFVPTELPHRGAKGSWSIDGGAETTFLLQGLPASGTPTAYNQIFFTTPEVQQGPHTLKVTFLGTSQTTPLGLDFLYVNNGTSPKAVTSTQAQTSSLSTQPLASGTQVSAAVGSSSSSRDAILGGAIAGCTLMLLILVGLIFWRRRKRAAFITEKGTEYSPTPFIPLGDDHHSSPNSSSMMAVINQSHVYSPSRSHETPSVVSPSSERQSDAHWRKQLEAYGEARYLRDDDSLPPVHVRTESNASRSSWRRTLPSADRSVSHQYADSKA